jgi:phosphoribosylaminoimidazolecarboxamide formyltransferase/IMP cyclohydrolase
VSDKQDLSRLARVLQRHGIEVLSTGGTYAALVAEGLAVKKVSAHTGAPEILGGRVKTLHPRIHGGILALPTPEHEAELAAQAIEPIDLVVVNLYPFRQVVAKPGTSFDDAVENIDIGGPAMVRAAAKNWGRVAIIVDPADYARLDEALATGDGATDAALRKQLAAKAYAHTAAYDAAIATYWAQHVDQDASAAEGTPREADVPGVLHLAGAASGELRYGENPHQAGRFYVLDGAHEPGGLDRAHCLQGKALSYNNLLDADGAIGLLRDLVALGGDRPAAVVIKHASPCGAALGEPGEALADVYVRAREADAESAFGGIVALGGIVDAAVAVRLAETFLEVVIAPSFTLDAREALASKKNLRLLVIADLLAPAPSFPPLRLRSIVGGLLAHREDRIGVRVAQGERKSQRAPSERESVDLEVALCVVKAVRSNAIVLVKGGVTVGIGGGQTSRVEAVRQAIGRAGERAKGAALASDAFFPFRDGLDAGARAGVTAFVEPGGSVRDAEVIAAADEHDAALVFTGERHFRH